MGHVKKLLSLGDVEKRSITATGIWTDLCENIHLHYRNVRLEFSEIEFAQFRAAINSLGKSLEKCSVESNYREGDPNFLIQQVFNARLNEDSDYYPNRVSIEAQRDGTVHFHYRDIRIHLTENEFIKLALMFSEAKIKLSEIKPFEFSDVQEKTLVKVDIDSIQPYDEGHKPGVFDNAHRSGIEFMKDQLKRGVELRPILVDTNGQRLDGFKRYFAQKELGYKQIECIVDPFGVMGGQHGHSYRKDDKNEKRDD